MKWIPGAKIKVKSGSYKGAIGYLVSEWPKGIWTVQPNENADTRSFYQHELELI